MGLITALRKFKKSLDVYQPLIEVKVFGANMLHNLKTFQAAMPKVQFAPVLKSNAYGHGLVETAKILDKSLVPFFMVDSLFEAKNLRHQGIKTPLLVLGYSRIENINAQKLKNTAFAVISLEQLKIINQELRRPLFVHLKIDTGMRRQGILPDEINEAVKIIKNNSLIKLEGVCSHFADSDGEDKNFSAKQIELWNSLIKNLEKEFGVIKFKHLANTAGADLSENINANVSRLGIGLYGFNLSPRIKMDLKPAMEIESIISSVKKLKLGEKIGYNTTFEAKRPMTVATVPVGYTEGFDRRLSNIGCMTINNTVCSVVGRVSMNMSSVDVSNVGDVYLEQKVCVISSNPADPNSVENIAKLCKTIPYEILVRVPAFLKRTVT